jgi:hypothetical protein
MKCEFGLHDTDSKAKVSSHLLKKRTQQHHCYERLEPDSFAQDAKSYPSTPETSNCTNTFCIFDYRDPSHVTRQLDLHECYIAEKQEKLISSCIESCRALCVLCKMRKHHTQKKTLYFDQPPEWQLVHFNFISKPKKKTNNNAHSMFIEHALQ